MQLSMFSSEARPARISPSQDCERVWMESVANSCSSMLQLLVATGPSGWYGRTSPASFRTIQDADLQAFWDCSPDSASKSPGGGGKLRALSRATVAPTASHGACLTLNLSEWTATHVPSHSDGGVCSLSDILETGDVPPQYYLSAKACRGILRRAAKRGKELPQLLAHALKAVAGSEQISTLTVD